MIRILIIEATARSGGRMPAKSEAQRRLMAAAAHGATFPKARELRASLTPTQLEEFSHRAPHPAKNLGGHLRRPCEGEICTQHHRGRRR
jgi:hypothetical protein